MIHPERIKILHHAHPCTGKYVLYWMQAAQRVEYNHALEYAIDCANEHQAPLLVFFGITDRFPEANIRHYRFMIEGLAEVHDTLQNRGISFACRLISPERGALELSKAAVMTVVDAGYLAVQKNWRAKIARSIACPLVQVETDVVVPLAQASRREEFSAATLRPKIQALLPRFLVPLKKRLPKKTDLKLPLQSINMADTDRILGSLKVDRGVMASDLFHGGTAHAKRRLSSFLKTRCERYDETARDPALDTLSNMSPYLHFGQISPLYIARRVQKVISAGSDAYLEELIVRRELSMNYVHYNQRYNTYDGLPAWAQKTLDDHAADRRDFVYGLADLEHAGTHDRYWNAAQREMLATGKMHGYMRMYWGKKILEWSESPRAAFKHALHLNNKYFLDGRDPNSFAGVAWCFGKHDRAWPERPVFGKVRYMNDRGLERKFDIDAYVHRIDRLYQTVATEVYEQWTNPHKPTGN